MGLNQLAQNYKGDLFVFGVAEMRSMGLTPDEAADKMINRLKELGKTYSKGFTYSLNFHNKSIAFVQ